MHVRRPYLPPCVLLGGSANAVSVARSLSREGILVHALGAPLDPVRSSRAIGSFTAVQASASDPVDYGSGLEAAPSGTVVLACADDALEFVAHNRSWLLELGLRPFEADDTALLAMLDKEDTYRIAREAGLPAPRTVSIESEADLGPAVAELGFPCALKPRSSHLFARHFRWKMIRVNNLRELVSAFAVVVNRGLSVTLTEIVPGEDDIFQSYYTYINERAEPLFHFTKRKLRQHPVRFGSGTYHVTDWDPEVADHGLRFFQAAGVRGLVNVEFKRDQRDGALKVIECNHRFTAANELVRLAGLDLALLAYNRLVDRPDPSLDGYRRGVHLWYPTEDFRAMLAYRRRGEISLGEWVRSLLHRQHFPIFRLSDPMPTTAGVVRVGRKVLDRTYRRAPLSRLPGAGWRGRRAA